MPAGKVELTASLEMHAGALRSINILLLQSGLYGFMIDANNYHKSHPANPGKV
jgi:hypothetical protein